MPRIVFLHGFTQTGASWDPVIGAVRAALGVDNDVDIEAPTIAPGDDLWSTARALADGAAPGTWCGYSMGGRLALHVALSRPELVDRLVLVGATPGIENDDERRARRRADDALAASIETGGVDRFLDWWLAQALFETLPVEQAGLDVRERDERVLAACLRRLGTGAQDPLWGRLGEIGAPTLLVTGERDEKFTAIARRMATAMPNASHVVMPGAGHACHLEDPAGFAATAASFMRA